MTQPDNWQRLFEHIGRLTGEVKRVADALERNGHVNEPEAKTESLGFWSQLRTELPYLCQTVAHVRWPRTAPAGFDKVCDDYTREEILEVVRAYAKLCDTNDDQRRWWGPGMFNDKRWPVAVELTTERPGYVAKEPGPNVMLPVVESILEHVAANYPMALQLRSTRKAKIMGREIEVTTRGPALSRMDIEKDTAACDDREREAYALAYLIEVWTWAENGKGKNAPRLQCPDLFVKDGKRRWPSRVNSVVAMAIRDELEAIESLGDVTGDTLNKE